MDIDHLDATLIDFPGAARPAAPAAPRPADFLQSVVSEIGYDTDRAHRCVLVAHLFDDTLRMLRALEPLTTWDAVIGIPYSSSRMGVAERWRPLFGNRLHLPTDLEALEATLAEVLGAALDRCARHGQRLIVQDVGGFAAPMLQTYFADRLHLVKGVIEITKQGVWRAGEIPLAFPVLHCADSVLKRLEAVRCGETVARCLDGVARGRGLSLAGRRAVVLGAGWIGTGVARALRRLDMTVALADPDPLKVLEARLAGFAADLAPTRLGQAALVVGAAGRQTITSAVMAALPDGTMLASASSRRVEIDTDWLEHHSAEVLSDGLTAFARPDGTRLLLVNRGFPANFLPGSSSVADEVVEAILGELIVLQHKLTTQEMPPGLHRIEPPDEAVCARLWLAMRDAPLRDA